jgi:hypothetical protein
MNRFTESGRRPKAAPLTQLDIGPRSRLRAVCIRGWRFAVVAVASCAVLLALPAFPVGAATANPHPLLNPTHLSLKPHVYGSYGYGVNLDPVTTIGRYYGPRSVANRCQLHIGAQATTNRQAVGSIEIYCFSAQYVAVDLRLYQNKRNAWVWRSANYTHVWKYVPARTWMVWDTDPGLCGSGFWQVDAQLAIYGPGRNSYFGPTGHASWFASQKKSFAAC